MNYNIKEWLNNVEITFSLHLFERVNYWNLELSKIEETVKTGKIL